VEDSCPAPAAALPVADRGGRTRSGPIAWWRARTSNERVVAAVLAGAAFVLVEVRFDHRQVLGQTWLAWLPVIYAAALLLGGGAALLRWDRGGRRILAALFALGFLVGALGIWFHTGGHPLSHGLQVLSAWRIPPGQDGGIIVGSRPPTFAPVSFWGLAAIGLIACARPST
jgi:hypothetical protein